ncbi:MAG: deoxyribonuclease IV [Candidatus Latescibacteria bacterium]|nr:deoxyribonuclease IV [Candidatus Latescibacterota bacterium]
MASDTAKSGVLVGAHMPTSGGLHNALTGGADIGCTAIQIFTKSPRQWTAAPLTDEAIAEFRNAREVTGLEHLAAHDTYLINVASPDDDLFGRSIAAVEQELDRCDQLDIPHLVMHPGSHVGSGEEAGLERVAGALDVVHAKNQDRRVMLALEVTAGQGTGLGWRFEHISTIISSVAEPERLAVCLDTAHCFAAGYDIRGEAGVHEVLAEFDRVIGLSRLAVIHMNDSKKELSSRVDRHEHIGEGEIGVETFQAIMNDPRLAQVPKIVETPEAKTMHRKNVEQLLGLAS